MSAPRERLIRKLSRIQAFGEKSLFLLDAGQSVAPPPADVDPDAPRHETPIPAALQESLDLAGEPSPGPRPGERAGEPDEVLEARWGEMEAQVRGCTRCRLCETRTNAVFGSGVRRTRLFVIGEGPGEQEDLRGEAFVGRAGELLTRILKAIGFERDQVFITNIVKCRPPRNRAPLPDEVAACSGYLAAQIEIVQPVVILTLGGPATHTMLQTNIPISRLRGRVHLYRGIPVVPTFHPAALLRNPEYKRPTWEDVQLLRRIYDERMALIGEGPAAGARPLAPAGEEDAP